MIWQAIEGLLAKLGQRVAVVLGEPAAPSVEAIVARGSMRALTLRRD